MSTEATPPVLLPTVRTIPQVRFSDTDALGHISSMSYAAWAEVGRGDFFTSFEGEKPWFVLVKLTLEFHTEGRFGEAFEMTTRCTRLGTKSMTLEQKIHVGERPVCTLEVIMACFDRDTRRTMPLPAHWRIEAAG